MTSQASSSTDTPLRTILSVVLLVLLGLAGAGAWWRWQKSRPAVSADVIDSPKSVFRQGLASAPSIAFHVANVRIAEESRPATEGTCREYQTYVTLATKDAIFRDRPGSVLVLVKDSAPKDAADAGGWVIHRCDILPVTIDAKTYSFFSEDAPLDDLKQGGFVAGCTFRVFKGCFDPDAGGDYEASRAVAREKPRYEFKLLSWTVASGTRGTLIQ